MQYRDYPATFEKTLVRWRMRVPEWTPSGYSYICLIIDTRGTQGFPFFRRLQLMHCPPRLHLQHKGIAASIRSFNQKIIGEPSNSGRRTSVQFSALFDGGVSIGRSIVVWPATTVERKTVVAGQTRSIDTLYPTRVAKPPTSEFAS